MALLLGACAAASVAPPPAPAWTQHSRCAFAQGTTVFARAVAPASDANPLATASRGAELELEHVLRKYFAAAFGAPALVDEVSDSIIVAGHWKDPGPGGTHALARIDFDRMIGALSESTQLNEAQRAVLRGQVDGGFARFLSEELPRLAGGGCLHRAEKQD